MWAQLAMFDQRRVIEFIEYLAAFKLTNTYLEVSTWKVSFHPGPQIFPDQFTTDQTGACGSCRGMAVSWRTGYNKVITWHNSIPAKDWWPIWRFPESWGYPQSSSMSRWNFPDINHPFFFGYPHDELETPICCRGKSNQAQYLSSRAVHQVLVELHKPFQLRVDPPRGMIQNLKQSMSMYAIY